jgi:hypothetical protein
MKKLFLPLLVIMVLFAARPAEATLVTSLSAGGYISMPVVNYHGPGPQAYANYVWSSTNAINLGGSVFGYIAEYAFGTNGFWNGALGPMAGLNDSFFRFGTHDTMTFFFATPVQEIGGFINYVPGGGTDTTIAIYDSTHTLLESYNVTFLTSGVNQGKTLGFLRSSADISYFTLTGNYIGIAGTSSTVPEPTSLALLGGGLILALGLAPRPR